MRLNLLGGLELVDQHNETVSFPHKRGQALLAYLAMKDGRAESREFIVDLLWPDRFKKQAQASLRQSVFELRRIQTSEPIMHTPGISNADQDHAADEPADGAGLAASTNTFNRQSRFQ